MNKRDKKATIGNKENVEDTTMYGEMIPSLHNWINPDNQMERVREIERSVKEQSKGGK